MSVQRMVLDIMTHKRGHGTETEVGFVLDWLLPQLADLGANVDVDGSGNIWVRVGASRTLFTCHTDSVHRVAGRQTVLVDGNAVAWTPDGECLGADDGAGIALLLSLIEAGKPGVYVFFRGEERGGIGSSWSARYQPHRYVEIDRAIAFDRRGHSDVITHQGCGRCCSDVFAEALAGALCDAGMLYMPDDGGVYTDTAELIDLVPECTNLSVGYAHEHGVSETLDLLHLQALSEALLQVDFEALPVDRQPGEGDPDLYGISGTEGLYGPDWPGPNSWDDLDLEILLDAWEEGQEQPLLSAVACEVGDGDTVLGLPYVRMHRMDKDAADAARERGWYWLVEYLTATN